MSDETPDEQDAQTPEGASSPEGQAPAEPQAQVPEDDAPAAKAAKPARRRAKAKAAASSPEGEGEGKEPAAEKKPAARKAPSVKKPSVRKKAPAGEPAAEQAVAAQAKPARRGSAPARRRVVRARARHVRTSARKARMVCGHLRGKSVQEARAILEFTPREVARDWSKLLESAVANAESNHELLEDDLIVREAYADEGPTIKRFRPRAMGRATPILKRTSHLTITLTPRA